MIKYISFLVGFVFLFISCDEIPPEIPQVVVAGEKVTLIEEFSGGSCVPCADAAVLLKEQLAIYGKNLAVVTYHTLTLGQTFPAPGAEYDFRTEDGQSVLEKLGLPIGIPSAAINRKKFEGEDGLVFGKSKWASRIADIQSEPLKTNMAMTVEYNTDSRDLKVDFTIIPTQPLAGDVSLVAVITESEIIDHQSTSAGLVEDFDHSHIFRALLSNINGESLGSNLAQGEVIEKTLTFTVPPEDGLWVAEHLEVVGYITQELGDSREILQAAKAYLIE